MNTKLGLLDDRKRHTLTRKLGEGRVDILRCKGCGKGLDSSLSSGKVCEYCGGRQWTNKIEPLSYWEILKIYRMTQVLVFGDSNRVLKWTLKKLKRI